MAEQEACTELVKQASQDQSSQSIDGESLLLPLLQGLLDAPENDQTHDSGTESGEDQRTGLIAEVQNALEKLSANLRSDTTDITSERRSSLLQLVTKLQAGLSSTVSDRRHSGQSRFSRRRERPDRHTIGVSSEELADARRLIEEISCPSHSSSRVSLLPKQNSEGSVSQHTCSYTSINPINQKPAVKNSTPKPFSCSNSASASSNSSSVQTPSESMDSIGYIFGEENKENANLNHSPIGYDNLKNDTYSTDKTTPDIFYPQKTSTEKDQIQKLIGESEEDESSTIKSLDKYPKPDIVMQSNPVYYQPDLEDRKNRFTTKKLKMRRANTIDIPKPLHCYECDDDEETDYEDEERRRRNNYLALRGPIRVGNFGNRNSVPALEPKTENDKKFLAFINKHNEKNQRHSLWASNADRNTIWNNKFDNLKVNFERRRDSESVSPNSARNFWQSADDSVRFGTNKYDPKISKQSARNLKKMFEEKQKKTNNDHSNIVTGSLRLAPNSESERTHHFIPQPLPVNKFSHAPFSAFQPINKNQYQPEIKSAPIQITKNVMKVDDSQGSGHLFLYSPKPLQNKEDISPTSPNQTKPWIGNIGESRVLALAAKKFENQPPPPTLSFQPKRLNKEKINVTSNFHDNAPEKLTAPYLVKSVDHKSNTVRKLSGQYDNLGCNVNKTDSFRQQPRVPENTKHIEGFQARFTVPQNYSIAYDRPKVVIPQKNVACRFPFEAHNASPSDVKRYNKTNQNEKVSSNKYSSSNFSNSYNNSQEHPTHQTFFHQNSIEHSPYKTSQVQKPSYKDTLFEPSSRPQERPRYECQTQVTTQIFNKPQESANETYIEPLRPKYNSQTSVESLKEYDAISSRVMAAPVAQLASTVRQKSPMTRNEHDMEAAFALKNVLQKVSTSSSPNPLPPEPQQIIKQETFESKASIKPQMAHQNHYVPTKSDNVANFKSLSSSTNHPTKSYYQLPEETRRPNIAHKNHHPLSESCEVTSRGEHIVTGKFAIPAISVKSPDASFNKPTFTQALSKSDSWHQICLLNQQGTTQHKPSPRSSPISRNIMKSKSSHCMIPPKQFEAGMTKEEIVEKKKTLEAFFGGSNSKQSPKSPTGAKVVKRAINRTKTSEKNAHYKQMESSVMPSGLARSRTLPDIVCPDMLDESNVDKAFEDLFTSS